MLNGCKVRGVEPWPRLETRERQVLGLASLLAFWTCSKQGVFRMSEGWEDPCGRSWTSPSSWWVYRLATNNTGGLDSFESAELEFILKADFSSHCNLLSQSFPLVLLQLLCLFFYLTFIRYLFVSLIFQQLPSIQDSPLSLRLSVLHAQSTPYTECADAQRVSVTCY